MKKHMKAMMVAAAVMVLGTVISVIAVDAMPDAPSWSGTKIGTGAIIDNGVDGGIAISDTEAVAQSMADGACQIGAGSNNVANTIKFRNRWLSSQSNGTDVAMVADHPIDLVGSDPIISDAGEDLGTDSVVHSDAGQDLGTKYAVGGYRALMVQEGTFTNGQPNVPFETAFSTSRTVRVFCQFTDNITASFLMTNVYVQAGTVSYTNFNPVFSVQSPPWTFTNCNFIAVGTMP